MNSTHATLDAAKEALANNDERAFAMLWDSVCTERCIPKVIELAAKLGRDWAIETFIESEYFDRFNYQDGVIATVVSEVAERGNISLVQAILAKFKSDPTRFHNECGSALEHAASARKNHALETLLALGADPKWNSSHPLYGAAFVGNTPALKQLIPLSETWLHGKKALHAATANGHLDSVSALLPVMDPNLIPTALPFASKNDHLEVLDCLLKAAAAYPAMPMDDGLSKALLKAVEGGGRRCLARLVTLTDPQAHDFAAFRCAVEHNQESIVRHFMPKTDLEAVRKHWTASRPVEWELIARLALWVPDEVAEKWIANKPGKFIEAKAALRERKALNLDVPVVSSRSRARP